MRPIQKQNKIVLVTGGAKGIGAEICRTAAKNGFSVAINYKSSKNEAEALIDELIKNGADAAAFAADVSRPEDVIRMFAEIKERLGEPWALVNNAGISTKSLLIDMSDEMWQDTLSTDLSGTFYCCREALKYMLKVKSGKIINIASMWGEVGACMEAHYSAAKAGVIGLTKALAKEVGPSGVTVNAVSPGVIMTDMMSEYSEKDIDALKDETPLERTGTPLDVAAAVGFLLSDNAGFITGQVLSVNGGFVI